MTKYRLKMALGDAPLEFEAAGPEGVLDAWRSVHKSPNPDHEGWRKRCASMACDFSGKPFRYDSDEGFAEDMLRHGLLEVVGA